MRDLVRFLHKNCVKIDCNDWPEEGFLPFAILGFGTHGISIASRGTPYGMDHEDPLTNFHFLPITNLDLTWLAYVGTNDFVYDMLILHG